MSAQLPLEYTLSLDYLGAQAVSVLGQLKQLLRVVNGLLLIARSLCILSCSRDRAISIGLLLKNFFEFSESISRFTITFKYRRNVSRAGTIGPGVTMFLALASSRSAARRSIRSLFEIPAHTLKLQSQGFSASNRMACIG